MRLIKHLWSLCRRVMEVAQRLVNARYLRPLTTAMTTRVSGVLKRSRPLSHKVPALLLKLLLLLVLLLTPICVYLVSYDKRDSDDKAVHYYSSAYFHASAHARDLIMRMYPKWKAFPRFRDRLLSTPNYTAANVFIASVRDRLVSKGAHQDVGIPYADCVKTAFLLMLIVAMFYLVFVSHRTPFGTWPMAVVLVLVALNAVNFPLIAAIPRYNMHPFESYVPRGSASLFVLAIFLAFANRSRVLFALSCLLLMLWHAAFAVLVLAMATLVVSVTDFLLCPIIQQSKGAKRVDSIFFPVVLSLLCLCAVLLISTMASSGRGATPTLSPINIGLMHYNVSSIIILLGTAYFLIKSRIVNPIHSYELRFLLVCTGFLVFGQLCSVFTNGSWAQHLLVRIAEGLPEKSVVHGFLLKIASVRYVHHIQLRLSGVNYLVLMTLVVFAFRCLARSFDGHQVGTRTYGKISALAAFTALLLIVHQSYKQRDMYEQVWRKKARFFVADCRDVKRIALTEANLDTLKPQSGELSEAAFFYSLAEFLFERSDSKQGIQNNGLSDVSEAPVMVQPGGAGSPNHAPTVLASPVLNGSFEDVKDGMPRDWQTRAYKDTGSSVEFRALDGVAVLGNRSASIRNVGRCDSRWVQKVTVKPRTQYELSGWIKVDDVEDKRVGAYIEASEMDVRTAPLSGSADWSFVHVRGTTGDDTTLVIACRLGKNGSTTSGSAFFDGVRLKQIDR